VKHLDKLRDEKGPQAYDRHCAKYKTSDCDFAEAYEYGWTDCQAEMMKVVEELREALEQIAESPELSRTLVGVSVQQFTRQALAKLRELEGEG
jgi:thymidylate synthase